MSINAKRKTRQLRYILIVTLLMLAVTASLLCLPGCTGPDEPGDESQSGTNAADTEGSGESLPESGTEAAPDTRPTETDAVDETDAPDVTDTPTLPESPSDTDGPDEPTEPGGDTQTPEEPTEPEESGEDTPAESEEEPTEPSDVTDAPTDGELTLPEEPVFDPSSVQKLIMPRLDIVTDNGRMIEGNNLDKPVYHSTVTLSSCAEEYMLTGLGAEVHVRGNSTAGAAKKPLALKFDEKQSVLGMNRGKSFKSWVLLADYYDETMLRNWMAFRLGDVLLENKWFSADVRHVEVYINGQYQGVYTLCEKTQIKKNRINIAEKAEDDLTTLQTGYLLVGQGGIWWEDNYFDIPIGFAVKDRTGKTMNYGSIRFVLSNGDEYSQAQRDFISDWCSQAFSVIEKALYHNEYYTLDKSGHMVLNTTLEKDTTKTEAEKQIETVGAVLDLEAAARMCVLDEIAKNLDAMTFNLYVDLSEDGAGKLTLAAPWDFDHAMAKTKYSTTHSTRGWYATNLSVSDGTRVNFLTVMLGSFDWFNDMCSEIWKAHYDEIRETVNALLVENYQYEDAFERDWEKWGHPLQRNQTGHHMTADLQSFKTHTDSAEFLAKWLNERITWLNVQWGDGVEEDLPKPDGSKLRVDFTKASSEAYLTGFNNCSYKMTSQGLEVTVKGNDPYFSVDYGWLDGEFEAEDFPTVVITYKVPTSNSKETYHFEYHMCAGQYGGATSGIKTGFMLDQPRGKFHTVETDLYGTGMWSGIIHSLRVDFFDSGANGDKIIIQKIELIPAK